MSWQTPDTYHTAGIERGTATSNFYETRDNLVVSIRRQFGPELFRLQEFMKAFASERLSDLNEGEADPNAVRAHLQVAYEHEIKPMVRDLKRALQGHGVDTVEAAMGMSITMPPALSAIPVDNPVGDIVKTCGWGCFRRPPFRVIRRVLLV